MSHLSPHPRPHSSASIASDTTFHSFNNHAEPHTEHKSAMRSPPSRKAEQVLASHGMHRQDSGYESMTPTSPQSPSSRRQSTTSASVASSNSRSRTRPSVRRSPKSGPVVSVQRPNMQKSRSATSFCPRRRQAEKPITTSYHHFPDFTPSQHPGTVSGESNPASEGAADHFPDSTHATAGPDHIPCSAPTYTCPPQTTHYWTSDQTRRLEYAAIDAASRGVKGWVMRHMVPDCFIPEERRRVRFDDDSGSVVRYRLDLDEEEQKKCGAGRKKKKGRWFSG